MGLNFRKSVKIAKGVKLNIGKKSASVSVGGKYAGASFNPKSGARVRASIPGTGISYTKSLKGIGKKSGTKKKSNSTSKNTLATVLTILIVIVAVLFIIGKNWDKISNTLGIGSQTTATEQTTTGMDAGASVSSDPVEHYMINTSTKKIHMPDCRYADTTSKNVSDTDKTMDELLGEGYSKCGTCMK